MEVLFVVLLVAALVIGQRLIYEKLSFRKFDYTCAFSQKEATQGEEIRLVEQVTNRKMLPLPWLRSELTTSRWLEYAETQSMVTGDTRFVNSFFSMGGRQRTTRSWKVKCLKRGVFPIEKCVLLVTDLAGLGSTAFSVKTDAELTVLPKPCDLTEELSSAKKIGGDVVVRRRYMTDPFHTAGVREYRPGDPLNRVHWPATARQGQLMVHNDECTAEQNLLLMMNMQSRRNDVAGVTDEDRIEDCIRICAGYLDDTLRTGIPVRFAVNATLTGGDGALITEEFAGREHVLDILRMLARLPLKVGETCPEFLETSARGLEASDIVLVTCFLSEEICAFAREKQAMGVRVKLVCAVAVDESTLPEDLEILVLREVRAS